jgi:V8-like Glu-specific endopeptidase
MSRKPVFKRYLFAAFLMLLVLLMTYSGANSAPEDPNCFSHLKSTANAPAKLVVQYINGSLYKWCEYETPEGFVSVFLLEPEYRRLDENEIAKLYKASRQWQVQYESVPAKPEMSDYNLSLYRAAENPLENPVAAGEFYLVLNAMVDNRTTVSGSSASGYPYYNTGFLTIDYPRDYMRGSAFLVSPYVALTNAHNLYSAGLGGWYTRATLSPGQYETVFPNSVQPYGSLSPVSAEVNENYIYHENLGKRNEAVRYDYAALFFADTFNGISTYAPLEFNSIPGNVIVTGYPGVVRDANSLGMWKADGTLIEYDSHCLFYDAYTSGGSSGGPVLTYNSQSNTYRVVAIHSFASPGNFSGGPHLNNLNRETIETWMRWTPDNTAGSVKSLALDKYNLTLTVGAIEALVATIQPADLANIDLRWSSSNSSIATVDAGGIVSAVSAGNAIITVQTADGSTTANCSVTVLPQSGEIGIPGIYRAGDINGDGIINVQDIVLAMQHVLLINLLEGSSLGSADVNGDGVVNVVDVTLLMQFSLGIIAIF